MPAVIFFALPNIFFQWPSVNDESIWFMNTKSDALNDLYERVGAHTEDEVEKIIEELSAGYDEVEASDFVSIDRYWIIVIAAVLHKQSLDISEDDLRSLLRRDLDYSWYDEFWEADTGELDENN